MKAPEIVTLRTLKAALKVQLEETLINLRLERNSLRRGFIMQEVPYETDVVQLTRYYRREIP